MTKTKLGEFVEWLEAYKYPTESQTMRKHTETERASKEVWDYILEKAKYILSEEKSHAPVQEDSLAELANRKGVWQISYQTPKHCIGAFNPCIVLCFRKGLEQDCVCKGKTYQAAEQKARAYLASLPDVKEGKI